MELNERNIIIDDSLNRIAEAGMESYITHAYCSAGECEVWYGGSLTLTDIADRFNFASLSHFSRYIQNNLGASPSSFRE